MITVKHIASIIENGRKEDVSSLLIAKVVAVEVKNEWYDVTTRDFGGDIIGAISMDDEELKAYYRFMRMMGND